MLVCESQAFLVDDAWVTVIASSPVIVYLAIKTRIDRLKEHSSNPPLEDRVPGSC